MKYIFGCRAGIIGLLLLTTARANCFAQHEQAHSEGEHESHGQHHVGLFFDATTNFEEDETDFLLALIKKLLPRLGIGFLGEVTFAEEEVFIVGAPIFLHPTDRLVLGVAPGLEIVDEISEEHEIPDTENGETPTETETNFLLRFITGYELELSSFTIVPTVSLDLVGGDASLVYGVSFGKGF